MLFQTDGERLHVIEHIDAMEILEHTHNRIFRPIVIVEYTILIRKTHLSHHLFREIHTILCLFKLLQDSQARQAPSR